MFGKNQPEQKQPKTDKDELKELLLNKSNNIDDAGILELAKTQLTGDLHQRKIARAIEIIENL